MKDHFAFNKKERKDNVFYFYKEVNIFKSIHIGFLCLFYKMNKSQTLVDDTC